VVCGQFILHIDACMKLKSSQVRPMNHQRLFSLAGTQGVQTFANTINVPGSGRKLTYTCRIVCLLTIYYILL